MPDVPKELERIILRCLRKEPGRRFQHMVDVKVELQELKEESDSQAVGAGGRGQLRSADPGAIVAVGGGRRPDPGRGRGRDAVAPAAARPSAADASCSSRRQRWAGSGSFSPDGTQIAYASAGEDGANWDIWLKIVGEAEARRLTTDPASEDYPAWSPDGTQIAFLRHDGPPGLG